MQGQEFLLPAGGAQKEEEDGSASKRFRVACGTTNALEGLCPQADAERRDVPDLDALVKEHLDEPAQGGQHE